MQPQLYTQPVHRAARRGGRGPPDLVAKVAHLACDDLRILGVRRLAAFHGVELGERRVAVLVKELLALGRDARGVQRREKIHADLHADGRRARAAEEAC